MPELKIPNHKEWKALKKKTGIPDKAVKNVHVGPALDAYYAAPGTTMADQKKNLEALGVVLKAFISNVDKKKIKKYDEFEREFMNNYMGRVHVGLEDIKRYRPNQELYKKDMLKFFALTQKLDPLVTTKSDLDVYRSGIVRSMAAMGSQVRGVDTTKLDAKFNAISDTINAMPKDISRRKIADFIDDTENEAVEIQKMAKALGIFDK